MRQAERDNDQLGAILRYCGRLDAALEHFGQTFEDFCTSVPFQDSCSLCLIQIGEATARLSDGFKEKHPEIDWRRHLRPCAAILFMATKWFDAEIAWDAIEKNIPPLREFCETHFQDD